MVTLAFFIALNLDPVPNYYLQIFKKFYRRQFLSKIDTSDRMSDVN